MKFAHATILVKNMEDSLKFYQEVIGLPIARKIETPTMDIVFLGEGETLVELIYDKTVSEISFGEEITLGFEVSSLDETMEMINEKNIPVHSGPVQLGPTTRALFILDPNGLRIQFIQY